MNENWRGIRPPQPERKDFMRVIDMADIIRAMQNETQFVLRCEEVFHDKISS